jgi:hypothetical protein
VDRNKIIELATIEEDKYSNVDLDHLMIYAMGELVKQKVDLSFENAVIAAFRLFPKKFALVGYSEYPDSDRVMNCLNRCVKPKHWLNGRPRQGFILNERSNKYIAEAECLLNGLAQEKSKILSKTRRKELIISELMKSQAYTKFVNDRGNLITESEMCNLLQGTLDSDKQILRDNLASLKLFSEELERVEVNKFLDWLGKRFEKFLK